MTLILPLPAPWITAPPRRGVCELLLKLLLLELRLPGVAAIPFLSSRGRPVDGWPDPEGWSRRDSSDGARKDAGEPPPAPGWIRFRCGDDDAELVAPRLTREMVVSIRTAACAKPPPSNGKAFFITPEARRKVGSTAAALLRIDAPKMLGARFPVSSADKPIGPGVLPALLCCWMPRGWGPTEERQESTRPAVPVHDDAVALSPGAPKKVRVVGMLRPTPGGEGCGAAKPSVLPDKLLLVRFTVDIVPEKERLVLEIFVVSALLAKLPVENSRVTLTALPCAAAAGDTGVMDSATGVPDSLGEMVPPYSAPEEDARCAGDSGGATMRGEATKPAGNCAEEFAPPPLVRGCGFPVCEGKTPDAPTELWRQG